MSRDAVIELVIVCVATQDIEHTKKKPAYSYMLHTEIIQSVGCVVATRWKHEKRVEG